eukprot:3494262-Rhodomonas_salina.5
MAARADARQPSDRHHERHVHGRQAPLEASVDAPGATPANGRSSIMIPSILMHHHPSKPRLLPPITHLRSTAQMYQVGKEYRSSARLNLLMLTWDVVDFWCRKAEVDARTNHLGQINDGWLADLRFKYKRFQTKDLPPVDKKDLQIKLASKIDELEAKELGSATKNVSTESRASPIDFDAVQDLTAFALSAFRVASLSLSPLGPSDATQVGIPGRVWMKRQVEWHHDVTALGSHQYLRKELAIRSLSFCLDLSIMSTMPRRRFACQPPYLACVMSVEDGACALTGWVLGPGSCNMRGCVAVPFQLSVDGEKPTDKDGQERGLVMLFYSSGRMNANSVDQVCICSVSHLGMRLAIGVGV